MSTTLDDAGFTYSGNWQHADDGSANLVDGTQSWTNDPTASFSFSFTGTGFDFCAGLKADRGAFTYTIDNESHGSGTELGTTMQQDPVCQVVASARNLAAGNHQVVFINGGSSYFAADAVTIYQNAAAAVASTTSTSSTAQQTTSSSSSSTSTTQTTQATSTTKIVSSSAILSSLKMITTTSSSQTLSSSSSIPSAAAQSQEATVSAGKKAAMVGGPLIAGILVAVLAFFLWMRYKRRREADSVAIAPSPSSHYLDDKDEKQPYSAFNTTAERFSPMQFAGRISPLPFGKIKGHNRLNSEMSLDSNTEPFQPTTLAAPPQVDPFTLPSGDFAAYRSSNLNPTHPAPALQRQSSYEGRLSAAAAALPNWRISRATEASMYPETLADPMHRDSDRLSTYSQLYDGMLDEDSSSQDHAAPLTGRNKYR